MEMLYSDIERSSGILRAYHVATALSLWVRSGWEIKDIICKDHTQNFAEVTVF